MPSAAIVQRVSMSIGSTTAEVPTDTSTFWRCTDIGFILGLGFQMRPQEAVAHVIILPSHPGLCFECLWIRVPGMWAYVWAKIYIERLEQANDNALLTVK